MKTKQLVLILMFGVVTSDGVAMPTFIFPHGLRLNREVYIKCLEEVVRLMIKRVFTGRSYIWKQNRVLCHTVMMPQGSMTNDNG